MSDIYDRLAACGFDRAFIREAILPEWWNDSLAEVPANRALAEMLIARCLGMSLVALNDPTASLEPTALPHVKFKLLKNTVDERVKPTLLVAERAVKIVAGALSSLPPFKLPPDPLTIRRSILRSHRYVDLQSLLEFCWETGIIVVHLAKLPAQSKRCDGLAMFCNGRPAVVLGSKRDSPAWLAFHLAHELGHILRRHVTKDSEPLVDANLEEALTSTEEDQANTDAMELLTGLQHPKIGNLKLNGPKLAAMALSSGPPVGVDPGVFTLIYGKSNDRWGVAQLALKRLRLDSGAHAMLGEHLAQKIRPEDLPEASERFISVLSLS
jgi:hypothetical protein